MYKPNAHFAFMKLKPGVTQAELDELGALLKKVAHPDAIAPNKYRDEQEVTTGVRKYDDEHGDPAFYIP